MNQIQDILKTMDYGPAPEDDSVARDWLARHKGRFGHVIGGKFTAAAGATFEVPNPANGEILAAVAAQLGNTPAVCKKAYVHPEVLTLGSTLAADVGAMNDIWKEIAGKAPGLRRLHAAEARLLAFLHRQRRQQRGKKPAQAAPSRSRKTSPSGVTA